MSLYFDFRRQCTKNHSCSWGSKGIRWVTWLHAGGARWQTDPVISATGHWTSGTIHHAHTYFPAAWEVALSTVAWHFFFSLFFLTFSNPFFSSHSPGSHCQSKGIKAFEDPLNSPSIRQKHLLRALKWHYLPFTKGHVLHLLSYKEHEV